MCVPSLFWSCCVGKTRALELLVSYDCNIQYRPRSTCESRYWMELTLACTKPVSILSSLNQKGVIYGLQLFHLSLGRGGLSLCFVFCSSAALCCVFKCVQFWRDEIATAVQLFYYCIVPAAVWASLLFSSWSVLHAFSCQRSQFQQSGGSVLLWSTAVNYSASGNNLSCWLFSWCGNFVSFCLIEKGGM